MRLAKYLAHAGVASRRQCERLIVAGKVEIDGQRVTDPAREVVGIERVEVDGRKVGPETAEHHALNKPVGVVSTAHDPQGRPKVTDLVESGARLYPVGRLDADSSGLIILTNDGELANRLMHPRFGVAKTYRVLVSGQIGDHDLAAFRSGLKLEDGVTAAAKADVIKRDATATTLELTIYEGRKRQIRRMCDAVGYRVLELERIRIGNLELGDLESGASRRLSEEELVGLRTLGAPDFSG